MTKVVINQCFGGFGVSQAAYEKLIEWGFPTRKYDKSENFNGDNVIYEGGTTILGGGKYWDVCLGQDRTNPLLVRVVEELAAAANGKCAELAIVEVPDDVSWEIDEYDGNEHVAESHRTWG